MFGISMPEMIVILVIALIVLGPKRLPELAKSLGKAMGEFKKALNDLKDSMGVTEDIKEVKKAFGEINDNVKNVVDIGISGTKDEKRVAHPAAPHSGAVNGHLNQNNAHVPPDSSSATKNRPDMLSEDALPESKDKEDGNRR